MKTTYEYLRQEKTENAIFLTIYRPAKRNALNSPLLKEMIHFLTELEASDTKPTGLVIQGAGNRAFVAGADISEMSRLTPNESEEFAKLGQEVTQRLENLPIPVIGNIQGCALGGGCELAMACDFIYATDDSSFGQPEVKLGLIPCFGGLVRLKNWVGLAKAKELIFTGHTISAVEAFKLGLVQKVFFDSADMYEYTIQTLRKIAENSPSAVQICKSTFSELEVSQRSQALRTEAKAFGRACSHPDSQVGMGAFLQKTQPEWSETSLDFEDRKSLSNAQVRIST